MVRQFFIIFTLMICLIMSATITMADLKEDLVGYWPLDGDGTDASGSGLDGKINGNVTSVEDRFGKPDSALRFPGAPDSHVAIEDTPALNITGAMTLVAWVVADEGMIGNNNGRIIAKQAGGGSRSWSLNIENAGLPATFQIATDGSTVVGVNGEPLPTDEWVHMAGVFRPGKAIEVYVNGKMSASNASGIPNEQFSSNGQPVLIGARNACGDCGWLGVIDDIALWKRTLTEDEIYQVIKYGPLTAPVSLSGKLTTTWSAIKNFR